jgi:hypothetical protein
MKYITSRTLVIDGEHVPPGTSEADLLSQFEHIDDAWIADCRAAGHLVVDSGAEEEGGEQPRPAKGRGRRKAAR